MKIAVLTISDTVARGERADASGPAVVARCTELGWPVGSTHVVADDAREIETLLKRLADEEGTDLILTTGGTGLGPRDVTPEATEAIADKMIPGFARCRRACSLPTPRAWPYLPIRKRRSRRFARLAPRQSALRSHALFRA